MSVHHTPVLTTDVDSPMELGVPCRNISEEPEIRMIDAGAGIRFLLGLIAHQQRLLIRCAIIGALVALCLAFAIPIQYQSTVMLMPPDQVNSSGLALISALSSKAGEGLGIASDLLGMKSSGALFLGILRSRTVQNDLVNRFDLRKVYSKRYYADARKKLANRTDFSEDRKSGIIGITVSDNDRNRAAALAQAYIDDLNRLVAQLTTSSAHRERVFLEERLKTVKEDLDVASVDFSQFASKNTAIDIPTQGKAMVESAAQLQGELIAAESELRGMEQIYARSNIRVRSLRAKIDELKHQLDAVGGKDIGLDANGGDVLYPSIRKLPLLGVRYSDLYRRVKIEEAVYEALTKQYELAKVEEAKEIPTVRVLDAPDIPEKKSFPPRLLIITSGLIAGFVLGVFSLLAKNWLERSAPNGAARQAISGVSDQFRHIRNRFSKQVAEIR